MAFSPKTGIGNVGSYQISGIPYASASITIPGNGDVMEVPLYGVARAVTIRNNLPTGSTNSPIRVGFSANGVLGTETNNYFVLNNGESYRGEWRIIKVFLMGDGATGATGSVIAEITGVQDYRSIETQYTGSSGVG